jgi:glycosyltransferase involved in cell wall biosynthesis
MVKLSAVIITFNEERNIERCIRSFEGVADEVIVVDSLSKDKTVAIAESLGARVIHQKFLGHIEQKNFALSQATYDHCISLDADEALDETLKQSVLDAKANFIADGYTMNRLTNYCGQWIKHCGWYPDTKLRLVNKKLGSWTGVNPHDRYELQKGSKIVHLNGDLFHYSFYTIYEHKLQIEKFTDISAKAKQQAGIRSSWLKILIKPIAKFVKSYFLQLGLLDGYHGWIICTQSARATYLKYFKLLKLQRLAA